MAGVNLSRTRLAAFVSPQIPLAAMSLPFVVNLPPFYANEMGLGMAAVGVAFGLARLIDVFLDPLFGGLSDRTRTRWGRRRPWIVIGAPLLLLGVWLLFLPGGPVSGPGLLARLLIYYLGWTFVTLSHYAWSSELSTQYHERSRVQGWFQAAVILGMTLLLSMTAILERLPDTTTTARIEAMGLFTLVLLPVTVIAALTLMGERDQPPHEPITFRVAWGAIAGNRALRRVLAADLAIGSAGGLVGALFIYFAQFVLQLGAISNLLLLVYFAAGILGIPAWTWLSRRLGKDRCFILHGLYNIVILPALLFLPAGEAGIAVIGFVVLGFNYGTASFLLRSMMSDVIDADMVETGRDRSGLYFALLTLTVKAGYALPLFIVYPLLQASGFKPAGPNTPEAIYWLEAMFVGVPIVLNFLGALAMWRYPINQAAQAELRRKIDARQAEAMSAAAAEGATSLAEAPALPEAPAGASIKPLAGAAGS